MAVKGQACTGSTGEEYSHCGRNALVLQSADPAEFEGLFLPLWADALEQRTLRRAGRNTARQYTWPKVLRRHLLPRIALHGGEPMRAALAAALRPAVEPAGALPARSNGALERRGASR